MLDLLIDDDFAQTMSFGISKVQLEQKLAVTYNRTIRKICLSETQRKADGAKKAQKKGECC